MKTKTKSWMDASNRDICWMERDNITRANVSLMTDGFTVWLTEQKAGENPTQTFQVSKRMFNWLVREYTKQRKLVGR